MRLTRAGEYAVRCILYLSTKEKDSLVGRREISQAMDIPEQFLGKIAQQLARSGFVEIVQGARGGYRLLKSPSEITLLAVVEAAIGGIFLNDCVMNQKSCGRSPFCAVHRIWEKARDQLRATLREASFDVLAAEESCLWSPSATSAKPEIVGKPRLPVIPPAGDGIETGDAAGCMKLS
jgi:Rrf2 family protein